MEDTFIGGFRGRTIKIREGRGWWAYGKRAPCWKLSCLVNADHYAYSLWRKYTHVTGLITRRLCTRVGPPEIARTYCNGFWWMLIWWVRTMANHFRGIVKESYYWVYWFFWNVTTKFFLSLLQWTMIIAFDQDFMLEYLFKLLLWYCDKSIVKESYYWVYWFFWNVTTKFFLSLLQWTMIIAFDQDFMLEYLFKLLLWYFLKKNHNIVFQGLRRKKKWWTKDAITYA